LLFIFIICGVAGPLFWGARYIGKKGLALEILNNSKHKNAFALYSLFYNQIKGRANKFLQIINLKKKKKNFFIKLLANIFAFNYSRLIII